jgi:hypothetical protein
VVGSVARSEAISNLEIQDGLPDDDIQPLKRHERDFRVGRRRHAVDTARGQDGQREISDLRIHDEIFARFGVI